MLDILLCVNRTTVFQNKRLISSKVQYMLPGIDHAQTHFDNSQNFGLIITGLMSVQ